MDVQDPGSVGQLTRLGLTSYEARAYLALIRRDSFTAAQVARRPVARPPAPPPRPLDCTLDSSRAQAMIRTRLRGVRTVLR